MNSNRSTNRNGAKFTFREAWAPVHARTRENLARRREQCQRNRATFARNMAAQRDANRQEEDPSEQIFRGDE
jgi:hypothetical protein